MADAKKSNPCKILDCGCSGGDGAKYQDEKYGKFKRVHNPCREAASKEPSYRCTVCGNEKMSSYK